ncbi:hypothetical protein [Modestobacter sp. KNN46-3]|uniref:hypothetical protein n=1 Tax=Modestobacter sp. KNN46-3 TaxID=2711218 RepID=UPI0013DEFE2A|nr:hypothetical protein [Modestobacter sp. KNN46-3]
MSTVALPDYLARHPDCPPGDRSRFLWLADSYSSDVWERRHRARNADFYDDERDDELSGYSDADICAYGVRHAAGFVTDLRLRTVLDAFTVDGWAGTAAELWDAAATVLVPAAA